MASKTEQIAKLREALIARREADESWKADSIPHTVCHQLTRRAVSMAEEALKETESSNESA